MRKIVLELAENATDRVCGDCDHALNDGQTCAVFGWLAKGKRHPHCLIAERTFSRLLDVSPEDAAAFLSYTATMFTTGDDPYSRVMRALRDHAKKAEVKP